MQRFFFLNRHKLVFVFVVTSLTMSGLVLAVFAIAYFSGIQADAKLIFYALVFTGIIFPFFAIFICYLIWSYNRWTRRKAFSKPPFNQLHELGFLDIPFNKNKRWQFTEELKAGNINGFKLIVNGHNTSIEVKAFIKWRQIAKDEFKKLIEEFEAHKIELGIDSFSKTYNQQQESTLSIHTLKRELEDFTQVLKKNQFEPLE